jgi:hypothetical protein
MMDVSPPWERNWSIARNSYVTSGITRERGKRRLPIGWSLSVFNPGSDFWK